MAGRRISGFSIDFQRRPYNTTVPACDLNCTRHGELPNLTAIAKKPKIRLLWFHGHSRSPCSDTNQKGICDFLWVVDSNLGRIWHDFGATAT